MRWLTLRIGGQKWTVHAVRGNSKHFDAAPDETVQGITYPDKCTIYVSRDLDHALREDVLLHEFLHAAFGVSGASHVLDETCSEPRIVEERLVRAMTPILHRLLADLGFTFPKLPGDGQ
jgi:hypothetical protein